MMKQTIIFFTIIFLSISCTKIDSSKRKPSSVKIGKVDLIEYAKRIQEEVNDKLITTDNCNEKLNDYLDKYSKVNPSDFDSTQVEVDGKIILEESFKARLKIHSVLSTMSNDCKAKTKQLYLGMRAVEDLVGVYYYKGEQISADKINYQEEKIPVFDKEAYHPYFLGEGLNPNEKFEFRNGDIMITKGISFVSSTISEIGTPKAIYSHIVFVHVDSKTKEVTTIESYVGKGVEIFPIEEALKNENARILILRPRDAKLASDAAEYMFKRVSDLKAQKKFIPYDYDLDFSENAKLSCEEVAYDSFKTVSNGQFVIPEVMSEVSLKDEAFLNRIGIKKGLMMVPADMETDSRFDIALDWTDYRVMRDSWRKDAVVGEMFRWSNDYQYSIKENFKSIAARIVWSTRNIPGLWNMMARVSGLPKDFTKDVPSKTIATMASLKSIGNLLLPIVTKADDDYFKATGNWMSKSMLRATLDNYRQTNPKDLEKVYRAKK